MAEESMPRVVILDLLAVIPFYDERLAAELRAINPNTRLVAVSPHRDPWFFDDRGLGSKDVIIDRVSRMPEWILERVSTRRLAKAIEYHLNVCLLSMKFLVRPPDVVHCQWMPMLGWSPIDMWFARFLRRRGIPLVHTVHNVLPHDVDNDRIRGAYAHLYGLATILVCHTEEAARRLVDEFGVASQRIEVIPHGPLFGIDKGPAPIDARSIARVDGTSRVVLSLGGIRPYKGLEFLLKAWQLVELPETRLVIAGGGDPEYIKEIAGLVEELDLGDTIDVRSGYVPDAEHDALHRVADIVVFPYRQISQSGALMTAMPYGRAIVATDVGGFREVIDNGRNGVLVRYGDTKELAGTLIELLNDPDRRRRLGGEARRDASTVLSWSSIADKTMNCYLRALESKRDT